MLYLHVQGKVVCIVTCAVGHSGCHHDKLWLFQSHLHLMIMPKRYLCLCVS